MTKELYFADTSVSVKYNKTLTATLFVCMKVYSSWWESRLRLVLYLPLDSHLELYISYKLAAVL